MVYEMGTGPIIDTLEAKARAGVKVQIILDLAQKDTNQKYMDRLKAAGADVIWSDTRFQFMHAKVIIVDELGGGDLDRQLRGVPHDDGAKLRRA